MKIKNNNNKPLLIKFFNKIYITTLKMNIVNKYLKLLI